VSARVGILTVSDACAAGRRADRSGDRIAAWCRTHEHELVVREVVPDETAEIVPRLLTWSDELGLDLLLTTGGTGLTPRDVTPEATRAAIEREAPGIAEEMRRRGLEATPWSMLSRGVVGLRGRTLIVNLPGSPGGVDDGLAVLDGILAHAVRMLRGVDTAHEGEGGSAP